MDSKSPEGYRIKTGDKKTVITPDRFKQNVELGTSIINALSRSGLANPPSKTSEGDTVYEGINEGEVKAVLVAGKKIKGVGPKGSKKLRNFFGLD